MKAICPVYSPTERLDVGHEEITLSGRWQVSHVDDPSFVVVPPRPEVAS